MNINDIQDGDTFLVRSSSFLSKMICKVMTHWGKKKGYEVKPMYSHAARFIWIADELYVFGSVANGYNPLLFEKEYNWDTDDFAVMRRKKPLTKAEKKQTTRFVLHLDSISIMYQYWNFLKWLLLVYLNINTFGKGNDKMMYCYESEERARKDLNPENYGIISETDIFDLLYDKNYEVIYKSKQ